MAGKRKAAAAAQPAHDLEPSALPQVASAEAACADQHADQDGEEALSALDRERLACMRRNQQRLQAMGLLPLVALVNAEAQQGQANPRPRKPPRAAGGQENEAPPQPLRRSLRAKGLEPELAPKLASLGRRRDEEGADEADEGEEAPRRQRPAVSGARRTDGDASKFDAHNVHRMRTMSDEAMSKRISKMSNMLKLRSLVQLLRQFGRDELAEQAEEALEAQLAGT